MKKKVLAALMAVLMVVGLAGCGSEKNSVAESKATESTVVSQAETQPSTEESEASIEDVGEEEESESVVEENGDMEENVEDEVATNEGKTLFIVGYTTRVTGEQQYLYNAFDVYKIDIATGTSQLWAQFDAKPGYLWRHRLDMTYWKISESNAAYSDDFTRFMLDKELSNGETHAGWLNADGTYCDVTELTGMASTSEFESQKYFYSLGFTPDGKFSFLDGETKKEYYVEVDNPSVAYDGNAIKDMYQEILSTNHGCELSDYQDSQHYLATMTRENCKNIILVDANIDISKTESLLNDGVRHNWSAVFSPDGESIAFLSAAPKDASDIGIYTMNLSDGIPSRLEIPNLPEFFNKYISLKLLDWQ